MVRWVVGLILYGVDWCNKGCGMCYPVCGMMHVKEPLLLMLSADTVISSYFQYVLIHSIALHDYSLQFHLLSKSFIKLILM